MTVPDISRVAFGPRACDVVKRSIIVIGRVACLVNQAVLSLDNSLYPPPSRLAHQRFMVETKGLTLVEVQRALTKKAGFSGRSESQTASV